MNLLASVPRFPPVECGESVGQAVMRAEWWQRLVTDTACVLVLPTTNAFSTSNQQPPCWLAASLTLTYR